MFRDANLDRPAKRIYPEPMQKQNLLRQGATDRGLHVSPSRVNPSPVAAFRAVSHMELPFILGGAPCAGHRYSVTGAAPSMTFTLAANGTAMELKNAPPWIDDLLKKEEGSGPLTAISAILKALNHGAGKGPFPFNGGAVGFFSYDLKDSLFHLPPANPEKRQSALGLPLIGLGFYDNVYVYDHREDKGYIVSRAPETESAREFKSRIEDARRNASETLPKKRPKAHETVPLCSNTTKKKYIRGLRKAKEYIACGDIYQINLSQRLDAPYTGDPFELYEGLIRENPTHFSSFFDFGGFQIISNSPERLLKVKGQVMETCPIKGTRPRGTTPSKDTEMRDELAHNTKERAEHVMIVDLERNDLGRIAIPGTVSVKNFEEIQSFSKVHHMVSTVRGVAPEHTDPLFILKNIFPGGSITGAPKIRAMEIIEELENVPREVYTGGAGFMDFSGDMDLSILIRTAITKEGRLYLHVGGGIVADSVPLAEYDETILKAMDFLSLLELRPEVLT